MPLFNEDGEEVPGALTKEEVDTKITEGVEEKTKEATEEAQKQIDDAKEESSGKITKLEDDLKEANELLGKASDKDTNFKNLRESKEALEKALEDERKSTDEKIAGINTRLDSDKVTAAIKAIIGNDQEKIDKAKFHFDHLKSNEEDKDDWKNRIKRSVFLATGSDPKNLLNSDVSASGDGNPPGATPPGSGKISEGAKDVGNKLGISDKEMKDAGLI